MAKHFKHTCNQYYYMRVFFYCIKFQESQVCLMTKSVGFYANLAIPAE